MSQTTVDPTPEGHGADSAERAGALPSRVALSSEKWLAAGRPATPAWAGVGRDRWWLAPARARAAAAAVAD